MQVQGQYPLVRDNLYVISPIKWEIGHTASGVPNSVYSRGMYSPCWDSTDAALWALSVFLSLCTCSAATVVWRSVSNPHGFPHHYAFLQKTLHYSRRLPRLWLPSVSFRRDLLHSSSCLSTASQQQRFARWEVPELNLMCHGSPYSG